MVRSSPWWILFAVALVLVGVALQLVVGGRTGTILIAGGLLGVIVRGYRLMR